MQRFQVTQASQPAVGAAYRSCSDGLDQSEACIRRPIFYTARQVCRCPWPGRVPKNHVRALSSLEHGGAPVVVLHRSVVSCACVRPVPTVVAV
jgi:hypothetical protein